MQEGIVICIGGLRFAGIASLAGALWQKGLTSCTGELL